VDRIDYSLFGIPWHGSAPVAVFGVAYDATSELAKGPLAFPAAIRLASYGIDHGPLDATDLGDVLPPTAPDLMVAGVEDFMNELWSRGHRRFFVMGGNHSITVPVVSFLARHGLKRYVQFDAHSDYSREMLGSEHSFACTLRRVAEVVDDVSLVGARSNDQLDDVTVVPGSEAWDRKGEVAKLVRKADYVSIDLDVFNVPCVTNPQPQDALTLDYVLDVLDGKKVGVDVVEGVPDRLYGDLAGTYGALIARRAIPLMVMK
jgi:agmatinase